MVITPHLHSRHFRDPSNQIPLAAGLPAFAPQDPRAAESYQLIPLYEELWEDLKRINDSATA